MIIRNCGNRAYVQGTDHLLNEMVLIEDRGVRTQDALGAGLSKYTYSTEFSGCTRISLSERVE